jgi:uncharacterized protein
MEQSADSPESSRSDGAEPATSRAEGGASASEHKEEERLDSEALIDVARRGELARVKEIIEGMKTNGVDINHQDSHGWTALMLACYKDHREVALELLKVDGLDVNIQNRNGYTALMRACSKGLTEVLIELLKVDGIDVNVQNSCGWTALMRACYNGHADIALALLRDPRVDRHIKDRHGTNALACARNKGLTAVVTLIEALDRGDERMPLVKVHHRYLYGDVAAEGAQAQAPHPPGLAITKILVDKNLVHYMSRFLAS